MRLHFPRLSALLLIFALLVSGQPSAAQSEDSLYFPETNLWVRGEFYRFYRQAPDPLLLFGYPISAEMQDATGNTVQYFERARFDLKPTPQGAKIVLANLGWMLFQPDSAAQEMPVVSSTCRTFAATGKSVCYEVLKFYDKYNGSAYFGDPITNLEVVGGVYVQTFRNARLEYSSSRTAGEAVRIADLGRQAFIQYVGQPPVVKSGGSTGAQTQGVPRVRVFVTRSVLPPGAQQTVTAALEEGSTALSGAAVSVDFQYRDGSIEAVSSGKIDDQGLYKASALVLRGTANQVVKVLVEVNQNGVVYTGVSWFRIWY